MAEMNRIPEAAKKAPQTTQEKNESEIDLVELFYRLVEKAKYIIACALLGIAVRTPARRAAKGGESK